MYLHRFANEMGTQTKITIIFFLKKHSAGGCGIRKECIHGDQVTEGNTNGTDAGNILQGIVLQEGYAAAAAAPNGYRPGTASRCPHNP
jgi:hypothetical protein